MKPDEPLRDIRIDAATLAELADTLAEPGSAGLTELQWTAFQYLADELTPELTDDFEQRLVTDPAAAEALEEMLSLVGELQAAQPTTSNSPASPVRVVQPAASRSRVKWAFQSLAAIAAAALVWFGISQLISPTPQESARVRLEAGLEGEQMAELWAYGLADDAFSLPEESAGEARPDSLTVEKAGRGEVTSASEIAPDENEPEGDDWLYSVLVSLDSLENWPTEEQGGS